MKDEQPGTKTIFVLDFSMSGPRVGNRVTKTHEQGGKLLDVGPNVVLISERCLEGRGHLS